MRLLTYLELSRYSQPELLTLLRRMYAALPSLARGTVEHEHASLNIRHLRIFIARREQAYRMRM